MNTSAKCTYVPKISSSIELKVLELYRARTKKSRITHIGILCPSKKYFIIFCGGFNDKLQYNLLESYELQSFKQVEGSIAILLEKEDD